MVSTHSYSPLFVALSKTGARIQSWDFRVIKYLTEIISLDGMFTLNMSAIGNKWDNKNDYLVSCLYRDTTLQNTSDIYCTF